MKNRDPPKPHILNEPSSDVLAEPPIFASTFHQNFMFFMFFPNQLPDLSFCHFFLNFTRKLRFRPPLWHPAGATLAKVASQIQQSKAQIAKRN